LWNRRLAQAEAQSKALGAQLVKIERQVAGFLEKILDASVPSVIAAYEDRIRGLEEDKHVLQERMAGASRPARSFEDTFRTAMDFLANPWKLWESGQLKDRQTVLKLVFADKLRYARKDGFRTTDLSLPFKILTDFSGAKSKMVGGERVELPTSSV
jgi:site-specific DNA recombinase